MFFSSTKHPGLHMNKWGVVFADRDHPLANTELWSGVSWAAVPLKSGTLAIQEEVADEARDAGYTSELRKDGERLWKKPLRKKPDFTFALRSDGFYVVYPENDQAIEEWNRNEPLHGAINDQTFHEFRREAIAAGYVVMRQTHEYLKATYESRRNQAGC